MSRRWLSALAVAGLLAAGTATAADAGTCTSIIPRPSDTEVLAGRTIDTFVFAERCGSMVVIDSLVSTDVAAPYRVSGVRVYRFVGDQWARHAAQSAAIPADARPSAAHLIRVRRTIPARVGYAGYVQVTLTAGAVSRTIRIEV